MNDADFLRHVGDRGVRTVEDARTYVLDGAVASYQRLGFGLYLVETKENGVPVGICGLVKRDFLVDVDLGFALAPEHRGRGYAREAASATVEHARTVLGLKRLAAIVSPSNAASIRLLRELGFVFERALEPSTGDIVDLYLRDTSRPPSDKAPTARIPGSSALRDSYVRSLHVGCDCAD